MKKITKYIYITIFLLIIGIGFVGNLPNLAQACRYAFENYEYDARSIIVANEFDDHLWNRYLFVEGNGLVRKILNQKRMNGIVRLDNGKLVTVADYKAVDVQAQQTIALYQWLQNRDIEFLYVQTPYEVCEVDSGLPTGVTDYSNDNANRFLELIKEEVPTMDLRTVMHERGMSHYDSFYRTDHHWKVETAFWAFREITEYVSDEWNIKIPAQYTDENSYSSMVLENVMLGSNGRKTGILYSELDDLAIMIPRFDTKVSFETEGILREGSFEEAYLVYERLEGENIYEISQYDVYIGGDYGVTTQTCENAPCDKKILIIKDSYSRPVMAFMGTVFSQVDTIDMRYFEGDVQSYIEQVQPDMVMVIYNPYMLDESSFAFGFEGQ